MKPVFWSALFLSVSVPALATAAALSSTPLTDWRVTPMTPHSGNAYCAMVTRYNNAPVVTFTRNSAGKGSIAFDFKNARLEKKRQYALTVTVDGHAHTYSGNAVNGTTLVVQLGNKDLLAAALDTGQTMTVSLDGTTGIYTLAGNPSAFAELNQCIAALAPAVSAPMMVAAATPIFNAPDAFVAIPAKTPAPQIAVATPQTLKMETPIKTVTIIWDNPLHPTQSDASTGFALSARDAATDSLNAKQLETITKATTSAPPHKNVKSTTSTSPKNAETLTLKQKLAKARDEANGTISPAAPEVAAPPKPAIVLAPPAPLVPVAADPAPKVPVVKAPDASGVQDNTPDTLSTPAPEMASPPTPVVIPEPPAPVVPAPSVPPVATAPMHDALLDDPAPPTGVVAEKPPLREITRMADPFNEPGKSPIGSMAIATPSRVDGVTSPDANIQSYLFDEPAVAAKNTISTKKLVKTAPKSVPAMAKPAVSTPKATPTATTQENVLFENTPLPAKHVETFASAPRNDAAPQAMPPVMEKIIPVSHPVQVDVAPEPAPAIGMPAATGSEPLPSPVAEAPRQVDMPAVIPTTDVSPDAPTIALPPALPSVIEPSASPIPVPPQPTRALSVEPIAAMPTIAPVPVMRAPVKTPRSSVSFQPAPAETRGNWAVRNIAGNGTDQAAYCLLENKFANDTRLMLGQRADGNGTIGINYGIDMLENDKNYAVTVQLDNDFEENFSGYAESPQTLVVQLGKKKSFFDGLSSARALRVAMPGAASSFKLDRIGDKLGDFSLCLASIGGTALAPATAPRDVSQTETAVTVAADTVTTENLGDRMDIASATPVKTITEVKPTITGLGQRVSALLRKAAIKPYKYAATATAVHWTDASDKLAADATVLPQTDSADAEKSLLDDATKACAGDFNFRPSTTEATANTTVRTFESKCAAGDNVTVSIWLIAADTSGLIGYEFKTPVAQRAIAFAMRAKLSQALQ